MFLDFPEGWDKFELYDGTDYEQQTDFEITIELFNGWSIDAIAESTANKDFDWLIMLSHGEKTPLYSVGMDFGEFSYEQIFPIMLRARKIARQVTKGLKRTEKIEDN